MSSGMEKTASGQRAKLRPAYTLLCFFLSIALIYVFFFLAIGTETALLYMGAGKAYNEILLSLRGLTREVPGHQERIFCFGDSAVDVFDAEAFGDNVKYMEEIVTSSGGVFLDLSHLLEPDQFQDRMKHYRPEAAGKVTKELVPVAKKILWKN